MTSEETDKEIVDFVIKTHSSLKFEPNDALARTHAHTAITEKMEELKADRRIYDFKVVCDESNNSPFVIDNKKLAILVAWKRTHPSPDGSNPYIDTLKL